jgi:hypothetical protein
MNAYRIGLLGLDPEFSSRGMHDARAALIRALALVDATMREIAADDPDRQAARSEFRGAFVNLDRSGPVTDAAKQVERAEAAAQFFDELLVAACPVADLQHPAWDLLAAFRDARWTAGMERPERARRAA